MTVYCVVSLRKVQGEMPTSIFSSSNYKISQHSHNDGTNWHSVTCA